MSKSCSNQQLLLFLTVKDFYYKQPRSMQNVMHVSEMFFLFIPAFPSVSNTQRTTVFSVTGLYGAT